MELVRKECCVSKQKQKDTGSRVREEILVPDSDPTERKVERNILQNVRYDLMNKVIENFCRKNKIPLKDRNESGLGRSYEHIAASINRIRQAFPGKCRNL